MLIRRILLAILVALVAEGVGAEPYNPYAESAEPLAPVAPDGTIRWGTFFKSAALQLSYERLWSLGACRGTSRAITEPVQNNKLVIDRLPENEFKGVVQAAGGTVAGGVVAFVAADAAGSEPPLFAQLHPAGVSHLTVTGTLSRRDIRPGMVVSMRTQVDDRGRGTEPLRSLTIVTPPRDFTPDAVRPERLDAVVGTVKSIRGETLVVQVDAGRLRRLILRLAEDAVVTVDGARLDLVAPGDAVEVKGRLWSGAGATGAGTIFASHVTVTKPPRAEPESQAVAAGAGTSAGRAVE